MTALARVLALFTLVCLLTGAIGEARTFGAWCAACCLWIAVSSTLNSGRIRTDLVVAAVSAALGGAYVIASEGGGRLTHFIYSEATSNAALAVALVLYQFDLRGRRADLLIALGQLLLLGLAWQSGSSFGLSFIGIALLAGTTPARGSARKRNHPRAEPVTPSETVFPRQ